MRLMLGGCWCFSKAPDPSGTVFDLGLRSLVLEQPAQVVSVRYQRAKELISSLICFIKYMESMVNSPY